MLERLARSTDDDRVVDLDEVSYRRAAGVIGRVIAQAYSQSDAIAMTAALVGPEMMTRQRIESIRQGALFAAQMTPQQAGDRAATIARTEIFATWNMAITAAFQLATERPTHKRWLTALDERVRPDHRALHDETVRWDELFIVGGYRMAYPHDTAGPADQVVNCRCLVQPLYRPVVPL